MTFVHLFDALLHPSARYDALSGARHRAFMAPRLLGSLIAFGVFPVFLVARGEPSALEIITVSWLIAPILLSYFLSRTGRFEYAHVLSSLALGSLITALSAGTGGIASPVAVWLIAIPIEAALSASRRVVGFAILIALCSALLLIGLGHAGVLPPWDKGAPANDVLAMFALVSALLYAGGLAFGAESLSRLSVDLLAAEEDRYRLLAHNISDVIARHHSNGAVVFISPAIEKLAGLSPVQMLGHGLFDRVHVADRPAFLRAFSDASRGGGETSVEFRLRREPSSDFVWVEMRCRPIEGGEHCAIAEVVTVMRDITDRKMQEQIVSEARAAAERADAAKTHFLATVSHELRTPLNAIIGFSEMITQEDVLRLDAARRKEYAQLINESGQHLLSVVNGILDMSKMETGNYELSPEAFSPREAIVGCCNILALKARDNGIDLVTRAPETLPELTADPRAFRQIVLNLVSNAIKFTERNGRVLVSARIEGVRFVLSVADNGVGIGSEDLKRVGDPFFQAGKTYQRRHEGTGLGLSIVKTLVGLHGGEMSVHSQLGEGTTIEVSLPLTFGGPHGSQGNVAMLDPVARPVRKTFQVKKSA